MIRGDDTLARNNASLPGTGLHSLSYVAAFSGGKAPLGVGGGAFLRQRVNVYAWYRSAITTQTLRRAREFEDADLSRAAVL